jgi:hypothetical protein
MVVWGDSRLDIMELDSIAIAKKECGRIVVSVESWGIWQIPQ